MDASRDLTRATDGDLRARTDAAMAGVAGAADLFSSLRRAQKAELASENYAGGDLSLRFLREIHAFPFKDGGGALTLAIAGPLDEEAEQALRTAFDEDFSQVAASAEEIETALAAQQGSAPTTSLEFEPSGANVDDLDNLRDLARGAPVVRALEDLMRLAAEQRATDLHIEPFEGALQVRLRIDGILRRVPAPPVGMAKGLLSRLKIIAGLNITERRTPQDGRARITIGGSEIDLRIATAPTTHGESAVVRLLRKGAGAAVLNEIGLSARDEATLRQALQLPFGMIIATGPTGSGKTTTLAASLMELNQPGRKILTIEDPVEYGIPGVSQTQVHPAIGLTFASALRSFLRHDPDVIMVGEMRDAETAHMGVHAALTGHLVLTTLHTNTAAGAITRLIDMGVESFLLSSCVKMIVAQRLVRVLCEECRIARPLTDAEMSSDPRYDQLGFSAGELVYHPKGCEWCGFSGYRGRRGLFEVLSVTADVRRGVKPRCESAEIEKLAREAGMTTMVEDGVAKCRAGLTTIDEVFRVTMSV
jgi:general secretion pathway protein E